MRQEVLVGGFAGLEGLFVTFCALFAAAIKLLFHEMSKPAAATIKRLGTSGLRCVSWYLRDLIAAFFGRLLRLL